MYGVFTKDDKGIQYLEIPGEQSIPCRVTVSQVLKEEWMVGARGWQEIQIRMDMLWPFRPPNSPPQASVWLYLLRTTIYHPQYSTVCPSVQDNSRLPSISLVFAGVFVESWTRLACLYRVSDLTSLR